MTANEQLLYWTGHPLIDVGIAALTAFGGRTSLGSVTEADLAAFAEWAENSYASGDLSKTVGILFTMNSFLNPSLKPEQRRERVRDAVRAYLAPGNPRLPPCVYCGRHAQRVLHRDDVPMILGRTVVNFYPGGAPGLAICGACQLALHGLTLGAPRCSGKALVVYADSPEFLLKLVRSWVRRTRRTASLSALGDAPSTLSAPRTRVVESLLEVQKELADDDRPVGIVAYHISNSGQGPGIEVYPLPSTVVRFLKRARASMYRDAWMVVERRAWQRTDKRGGSAADVEEDQRGQYRNYLYEDLFRLPEDAARFIRLYFLRRPAGLVRRMDADPRTEYSPVGDISAMSWNLVTLFLREVLGMQQERVDAIRALGDRLAEEIMTTNDEGLLRKAYLIRSGRPGYESMRRLLLQVCRRRLDRHQPPAVGFEDYLTIFEEGEELARADWRLAWDLTLIRVIEQLHVLGKDALVREALAADEVAEAESDEQAAVTA